jgi:hypothetical protein
MPHVTTILAAAIALSAVAAPLHAQQQAPPEGQDGVEVLTRGPVHEAFAEPVVFDPKPGVVVPKAPPQAIEEMPPDQKPEGENVTWISGYWSWDDERDDFLWISGIWRDLPPGRQWVPGYWAEVQGGYQWVAGYWAGADQGEANYLPSPPETLEAGPNTPAPSENHVWAPGCWYYRQQRYIWRPGYWFVAQPNWVWVPAHYVWTPGGCLFVEGYWDFAIARRGLLFAPVYVPPVVIARPAFVYTPTVVIQNTVLVDHFWCRPRYGHYYFGDYYAPAYQRSGFFFWLSFNSSRVGYDPIFVHQRFVQRRVNVAWETRVREVYRERVVNIAARPPRTFAAQRTLMERRGHVPGALRMGAPLAEVARARADMVSARAGAVAARNDVARTRLEQIGETRRAELAQRSRALRQFQEQRRQREARVAADIQGSRADRAERLQDARERATQLREGRAERLQDARERAQQARTLELPKSPVAARPLPRELRARRADAPPTIPPAARGGERAPVARRPDQPAARRPDQPVARRPDQATVRRPDQSVARRTDQAVARRPDRSVVRPRMNPARPDGGLNAPAPRPERPQVRLQGPPRGAPSSGSSPAYARRPQVRLQGPPRGAGARPPAPEAPGPRLEGPRSRPGPDQAGRNGANPGARPRSSRGSDAEKRPRGKARAKDERPR